ncbi:hypothetical protein EVAR_101344_1 [Eumeta japonica]|uniref:Uncharacterized protein n=1 Tax=Eumeta variegata TaxID=151549 RepID=A0A4C1STH5_EUMVA|nr:hypothetical protein EVAR_101344_1 [Eumeta japonica]
MSRVATNANSTDIRRRTAGRRMSCAVGAVKLDIKVEDCKATVTRCATYHRFGRRDAETHRTASKGCPARKFAEERSYPSSIWIGVANCVSGRSTWAALRILHVNYRAARRLGLDLVLVQEQYAAAENLIQTGSAPKAGIMTTERFDYHCTDPFIHPALHGGARRPNDLYVVSGYLNYSDRPYLEQLNFVLNSLRGGVLSSVLTPMHTPDVPATFAGARGESNIDLYTVHANRGERLESPGGGQRQRPPLIVSESMAQRAATSAEPIEEPVRFRGPWSRLGRIRASCSGEGWSHPVGRRCEGGRIVHRCDHQF